MLISEMGLPSRTVSVLEKKKIYTDDDLVRCLPRRFHDYREVREISECPLDTCCAIKGIIRSVEAKKGAKKYLLIKVEPVNVNIPGGWCFFSILLFTRVFMFQRFEKMIGKEVVILGKPSLDLKYGYSITEPDDIVLKDEFKPHIATVYSKFSGISDEKLRECIELALKHTHEPLEWELMTRLGCIDYKSALMAYHYPKDKNDILMARRRLLLNDLLQFAIGLKRMDAVANNSSSIVIKNTARTAALIKSLPFKLTPDQNEAIKNIYQKASGGERVNILLQGDVGSGKTIVAIASIVLAVENGCQAVMMAPRGVLARQHYESFKSTSGIADDKIVFLHSGMKTSERKAALKKIASGEAMVVIGTHSCIADDVKYHKLGLVVTDEEHLFGVAQKEKIIEKACEGVHTISMSATPIPRTLASVIYGESKEVVQIMSMPEGRLPIKSAAVSDRAKVFSFMLKQIRAGHQCYVVCPAIEENEDAGLVSIEMVEQLYREYFEPLGIKIVIANGKMDPDESEAAVREFSEGRAHMLISTTVIEVGVNVPNATCIVIEQAERFGLASLHQLRGRVGRNSLQSYCILRTDVPENDRIKTICSTTNGFEIAEADLAQRGSGNLLGVQQAGANKYIELMLAYPDLFKKLQGVAAYCIKEGLGERLLKLYEAKEG